MWRRKSSTNMTSLDTKGSGGVYEIDTSSKSTCSCAPALDGSGSVSGCRVFGGAVGDCATLDGEFGEDCSLGGGVVDAGVKKFDKRDTQSDPVKWFMVIPRNARLIVFMPLSAEKPALKTALVVCAGVLENIYATSNICIRSNSQ